VRSWLKAFEPRVPESVLGAFETEVYRTRRDYREKSSDVDSIREESA
jgi:hypothetical protein